MDKNIYKKTHASIGFMLAACAVLFLGACKKNIEVANPGIAYGITGIEPAMAGAGDTVKVYGVGFQSNPAENTVKLNGAVAKIIAATQDVLTVVVPVAPRAGQVSVQTGSSSFTYDKSFTIATVVTGDQTQNATWSADKLYLLKGITHFKSGSTLTIQAGTVILADKATTASLIIDNGATVAMNGTADQPIVFSSNQLIGFRNPGDWTGITLAPATLPGAANDVLKYVRIEYAGYHNANTYGSALQISRGTGAGNIQNVQCSYSMGDGFRFNSGTGTEQFMKYLIAFGCGGNDFTFTNNVRAYAQFLLGLKDPLYADQSGADGLLVQSTQPVTVTNLTLMGYNGLARKAVPADITSTLTTIVNDNVINTNAGRGVHIGGYINNGSALVPATGTLQLFNSLIAAPWLAGISIDGPTSWNQYENGTTGSVIRKTTVTYTLATAANSVRRQAGSPPFRGYSFSKENTAGVNIGFEPVAAGAQKTAFTTYNDTLRLMMIPVPTTNPALDDLGIGNMALYSRISNPLMTPTVGSVILTGADFSNALLGHIFFDKTPAFRGAFGTTDWTKPWSNYVPQQTSYN